MLHVSKATTNSSAPLVVVDSFNGEFQSWATRRSTSRSLSSRGSNTPTASRPLGTQTTTGRLSASYTEVKRILELRIVYYDARSLSICGSAVQQSKNGLSQGFLLPQLIEDVCGGRVGHPGAPDASEPRLHAGPHLEQQSGTMSWAH